MTITRKTDGDLLVSQTSIERWFTNQAAATNALREVTGIFADFPLKFEVDGGGDNGGEDGS